MERPDTTSEITSLLLSWSLGDRAAYDHLIDMVYGELRRLAAHHLRQERLEHTLQPTALVHEAYLRLVGQTDARWHNRDQFFAVAAQAMRRVLVDHARNRLRRKRGGDAVRLSLHTEDGSTRELEDDAPSRSPCEVDLIDLDRALTELGELDASLVRLVELRYFGGLTIEETAAAMDVSPATVKRGWMSARAWLLARLGSTL